MEAIHTRGKVFNIPSTIEELTPEQYEYYCFLAVTLALGSIDTDYFKLRWMSYLLGYRRANYTMLKDVYVRELESQISALNGFFIEAAGITHINFDTTVNLLPTYRGYKGPGDWLEGVTFGQFIDCWTEIESMANADEAELMKGYEQIARRLYNIPDGEHVPELLAFHAPRLFTNVWKAIQSGPIDINGKKIDFRIIFRSSGQSRPDDKTGWAGIAFEVAGSGVFGNVKQVEQTEFWTILLYLYKCKFEYNHEQKNK